jgi:hypothetical protein
MLKTGIPEDPGKSREKHPKRLIVARVIRRNPAYRMHQRDDWEWSVHEQDLCVIDENAEEE